MKQQAIIFIFLSFSVLLVSFQTQASSNTMSASMIPEDAIRFRILANSNSPEDQALKRDIRDVVRAEIESWVEDYRSVEKARAVIRGHLPEIRELVRNELRKAGQNLPFSVQLGTFAFPTKLYGSFIYPAGDYEAVLITLGEGLGANWWCVLFPPLCFLDIDSGEAVKEEQGSLDDGQVEQGENEVEVKFFIIEWFSDFWSDLKQSFATNDSDAKKGGD